jgi:hypothetical protein
MTELETLSILSYYFRHTNYDDDVKETHYAVEKKIDIKFLWNIIKSDFLLLSLFILILSMGIIAFQAMVLFGFCSISESQMCNFIFYK